VTEQVEEEDVITLENYFNRNDLQENDVKKIIYQLIDCLLFLKDNHLIHGNLSTNEIYLTKKETLKIKYFDFSLCLSSKLSLNESFDPLKSPEYSVKNGPTFDDDLWAIGAFWYRFIFGKYPYNDLKGFLNPLDFSVKTGFSQEALDLLQEILKIEPNQRIELKSLNNNVYFDTVRFQNHFQNEEKESDGVWIPDELMTQIFEFLEPVDLASVSSTNRHWNRLTSNISWKSLFLKDFYHPSRSFSIEQYRSLYIKKYKENMIWKRKMEDFNFIHLLYYFFFWNQTKIKTPNNFFKENFVYYQEMIFKKISNLTNVLNFFFIMYLGVVLNQSFVFLVLGVFLLMVNLLKSSFIGNLVKGGILSVITSLYIEDSLFYNASMFHKGTVLCSIALFIAIGESIKNILLDEYESKLLRIQNWDLINSESLGYYSILGLFDFRGFYRLMLEFVWAFLRKFSLQKKQKMNLEEAETLKIIILYTVLYQLIQWISRNIQKKIQQRRLICVCFYLTVMLNGAFFLSFHYDLRSYFSKILF
jgi:hypothetical protein